MSSEWNKKRLAEISEVITGYPFKGDMYLRPKHGVRVVRGDNVTERYVRWGEKEKCWPSISADLKHYVLRAGDVVIGMDGSKVGKNFAAISADDDGALLAQRVARVRAHDGVSQDFVRYLICNDTFTEYVKAVHTGTSIPHISKGQIEDFQVVVPPLEVQSKIAELLTSLDDRITLLSETNATLEAIAQALFKSWFVDFDPVRSKMEGRAPGGMDEATAALFPDSLEETELGVIPRGWRMLPLAEAVEINPKRTLKKGELATYLDMASVNTQGHTVEAATQREMGSGSKFVNGDTLLARITPCLENGKTAFVDFLLEGETGWGSTEFVVLRPHSPVPDYFVYLLCRHDAFREFAIQSMSGTSGRQRVQNDVLGRYPVAIPPAQIANAFGQVVSSVQQRIAANHASAQTLSTLRDTLLPRLISGQLRLPEAAEEMDAMQ